MNEAQTRLNKIDPKLRDAGWGIGVTGEGVTGDRFLSHGSQGTNARHLPLILNREHCRCAGIVR